jgi:hypothetical protein
LPYGNWLFKLALKKNKNYLPVDEKWGEESQNLWKKPVKTAPKSRFALINSL